MAVNAGHGHVVPVSHCDTPVLVLMSMVPDIDPDEYEKQVAADVKRFFDGGCFDDDSEIDDDYVGNERDETGDDLDNSADKSYLPYLFYLT